MRITMNRSAYGVSLAVAATLCAALLVPASAFAATISGTVKVGSVAPTHPVNITLWEEKPVGSGNWEWSDTFFATTDAAGAWSITGTADATSYKVVADDQPYSWYKDTAYPAVDVSLGDVTGGTSVTGNNPALTITMTELPQNGFKGKVSSATTAGVGDILVSALTPAGELTEFSTMTLPDGSYQLRGLATSTSYKLKFEDYSGNLADYTSPATAAGEGSLATLDAALVHKVLVSRVAPTGNFWTQPVSVAKKQFADPTTGLPDYTDVQDIVIASGDVKAQADPLAAAGLCWLYQVTDDLSYNAFMNAPLLLVSSSTSTDISVKNFIADVAKGNGDKPLTIHIVGGPGSVPDARFTEISAAVVAANKPAPTKDRIALVGNRYTLAQDIANRMKTVIASNPALGKSDFVLVANGADATKFFDPLALAPIAAANGAPILLVSATSVPAATSQAIANFGATKIYVGGGAGTVQDKVLTALGPKTKVERIWGANRYTNAIAIANKAITMGWLYDDGGVGVASTITDAQLGGLLTGNEAAPLLITAPTSMNTDTRNWLIQKKAKLTHTYVVGSTSAISASTLSAINTAVGN